MPARTSADATARRPGGTSTEREEDWPSAATAFGTVSAGFTPYHARSIRPSSSIRNDERRIPPRSSFHVPRVRGCVVGVGEQREAEVELLVERELLLRHVGRDADDVGPDARELPAVVAQVAGLDRAARGVGCR